MGVPDMHEALISKGQVRGTYHQDMINSKYNCALRHHICPSGLGSHTGGVGGDAEFEKYARHLVLWEGRLGVRDWLESMQMYYPTVARDALMRFDSIDFGWRSTDA